MEHLTHSQLVELVKKLQRENKDTKQDLNEIAGFIIKIVNVFGFHTVEDFEKFSMMKIGATITKLAIQPHKAKVQFAFMADFKPLFIKYQHLFTKENQD